MKINSEQNITLAVTAAVVGLFIVAVYFPQRNAIKQLDVQIEEQNVLLLQAKEEHQKLVHLDKRVNILRESMASFYNRLAGYGEIPSFIKQIIGQLESAKLTFKEMMPQSPVSTEKYSKIPIILSFQGSFWQICSFLDGLENMDRLVQIEKLELKSDASESPMLNATMILNICCDRSVQSQQV